MRSVHFFFFQKKNEKLLNLVLKQNNDTPYFKPKALNIKQLIAKIP